MLKQQDRVHVLSASRKKIVVLVFLFLCAPVLYFTISSSNGDTTYSSLFTSTRYSLNQVRTITFKNSIKDRPIYYPNWNHSFSKILEDPNNRFDISGHDVIVFIHIQKTAGTSFEKFLVKYLEIGRPCLCIKGRKRCTCTRPGRPGEIWLFSRYSTGWVCGLHADFTELYVNGCVETTLNKKEGTHSNRRYFYTSFLREPISRFISEYRHVNRGATWITSRHVCNGRSPSPDELPYCFDPQVGWSGVTLDEFLHCPFNLAFNRQTRMLADLTLVNCYKRIGIDEDTRNRILLESAKNNLRKLAYYGIKERMDDSQWMFEQLFHIRKSKSNDTMITDEQMGLIHDRNRLDIELYEFALTLFEERLQQMKYSLSEELPLIINSNKKQTQPNNFSFSREYSFSVLSNKLYYINNDNNN